MRVEVMLIEDRAQMAQVLELILAANTAQGRSDLSDNAAATVMTAGCAKSENAWSNGTRSVSTTASRASIATTS